MANVCGKAYGLTAMTRMRPAKTYGLRMVFALIQISLLSPAKRSAIAIGAAGPLAVGLLDGGIRVLVAVGMMSAPWRPASTIAIWLGLSGWTGTLAGVGVMAAGFAAAGALAGSFYQPKWTLLGKINQIQVDLTNLSFIHFARWVIIKKGQYPRLAENQPEESLHYDYLLFESNFNGDWEKYIDAFSDVVPGGMDNIWRWSERYPFSRPITPFLDYIRNCQYDTDHYYSAYPGASTNDVLGALALDKALTEFTAGIASATPEQFAAQYAPFTIRVQNYLATTGCPPFPLRRDPSPVKIPEGASVSSLSVASSSASAT